MTVLLLEDDYGFRSKIKKELIFAGFDVYAFKRIDLAKEYINDKIEEVDCVIIDLNMDDEFLDEYRLESKGGLISGWIFFKRYIYPSKPNIPTIIYSGLDESIDVSEYNKVVFLEKAKNDIKKLISTMNKLIR